MHVFEYCVYDVFIQLFVFSLTDLSNAPSINSQRKGKEKAPTRTAELVQAQFQASQV